MEEISGTFLHLPEAISPRGCFSGILFPPFLRFLLGSAPSRPGQSSGTGCLAFNALAQDGTIPTHILMCTHTPESDCIKSKKGEEEVLLNIRRETKEYNYGKHKCHEHNPVNHLAPKVLCRQMLTWPLSDCLLLSGKVSLCHWGCLLEPRYCFCKIGGPLFLFPQSPLSILAQNWLQVWGTLLSGVRGAEVLNFRWILPRKVALSTWALSLI